MLKVLLVLIMAVGFVACDEDDLLDLVKGDAIPVPEGLYESNCFVDGSESSNSIVEIQSQTEIQITTLNYTDDACSAGETSDPEESITIVVSDFSVAGGVAYFTNVDEATVTAYAIVDGVIYLSASEENITEDNFTSLFAGFIADPTGAAETVLTPTSI